MPENNMDEELKNLIVENLADTKILKEEIIKIKSYMRWRTIISIVWILLFVLPLIASFFILPDLLKGVSTSIIMLQNLGL
ncbi:MAG: hypothetical protein WCT26_00455 [Candidatus Buchananbacteria bacterium]|jgi:hypothetical protein